MSTAPDFAPKLYTAEDLERLSAAGHRYELIQGELRPTSPAGGPHGRAVSQLATYFNWHVEQNGLGATFAAETGFQLRRDPDTTKAPDWAFIQRERLPEPLPAGYVCADRPGCGA